MEIKEAIDIILHNAIDNKASDVHFEPERNNIGVRFRIDGVLYKAESLPKDSQNMIASRIKVLSEINITEHQLPQDGHFEFVHNNKVYNIRVSTFQTSYGETIVLRILDREDILIELETLGFYKDQLETMNKLINNPYGMVLITGPCGSGKTTLLYSILSKINNKGNNIITLEDPIEFQLPNIRQSQINEKIGLGFSKGLRAILRQDPDVIMVGEIRDSETAQMAVQASLTGILVFSTFHTLDVPALVTRFIEMRIPRSVVAQALTGIVSSRLMRKICDRCKTPYQLTDYEKKFLGDKNKECDFQKGRGCDYCHGSGYSGQVGIFEISYFDKDIKDYIISQESPSGLRDALQKKEVKTLQEAAIQKVFDGVTTIEEAIRVVGERL